MCRLRLLQLSGENHFSKVLRKFKKTFQSISFLQNDDSPVLKPFISNDSAELNDKENSSPDPWQDDDEEQDKTTSSTRLGAQSYQQFNKILSLIDKNMTVVSRYEPGD